MSHKSPKKNTYTTIQKFGKNVLIFYKAILKGCIYLIKNIVKTVLWKIIAIVI